ncbi:MAG: 30S ribosomal protein S21 [Intestinibacter sp.]
MEGGKECQVRVRENETLDSALRRFKRQCAMSDIMSSEKRHYDKPSVKRKKS